MKDSTPDSYYIYMLKCADNTLYTGSTDNIQKRLQTHNTSKTGAKYTKSRRPVELIYSEKYSTKSEALKREWQIKKMSRAEKIKLFQVVD